MRGPFVREKKRSAPLAARKRENTYIQTPTAEEVLTAEGYQLLRSIGEGGYGRVLMAIVPGCKDPCALKIVACKGDDTKSFDRERGAIEKIQSLCKSNDLLMPIERFEVHEEYGFLSYVMPLADDSSGHPILYRDGYRSRTLSSELEKRGRLPVAECVSITKRVLQAVKLLHAKGLIHRDIKLGNVIYLQGLPVLADFSLATHECVDASQVCSPSNQPPEGVGAVAGDIYAVAILLYRLATNNPASSFPTLGPASTDPAFPRLIRVFTMAGEKEPSRRYINAQAMEMALDWVMEDSVQAAPVKMPRKPILERWRERRQIKPPDPQGRVRFKTNIQNIVEAGNPEDAASASPQRDYMNQDDFDAVVANVCLAFERRIGFEPPLVAAACLMARTALVPDKSERDELIKNAAVICVGSSGIGMMLSSVSMALGWGLKVMEGLMPFFTETSRGVPVTMRVSPVTRFMQVAQATRLMQVAQATRLIDSWWLLFAKDDPKARAERATKALLEGVNAAIDELWEKYGDQLSL